MKQISIPLAALVAGLVIGPVAGVAAGWWSGQHYAEAGPPGPAGPAGPVGPPGPQGKPGLDGRSAPISAFEADGPTLSGAIIIANANVLGCPDGTSPYLTTAFPIDLYPNYRLCQVD